MLLKFFYFFLVYSIFIQIHAQSLDPRLRKVLNQSGLTIDEAKKIAEQQGLIDINSQNNNQSGNDIPENDNLGNADVSDDIIESFEMDKSNNNLEDSSKDAEVKIVTVEKDIDLTNAQQNKNIKYFGYDIFLNNPEIFQSSVSEYVDPDYIIGPGDEIIILLWGETELNNSFFVEKDGYLFIPNVGQVFVNGLTLKRLEAKLFQLLKKVYSSLDTSNGTATTFFDVSLGSLTLRPTRIFALGEVNQPGAYEIKSTATLFTSLYYFNGPSYNGTLRNIKLIRESEEIATIDFYDYLLNGKQLNDQTLQRDDVIFIPKRGKTVSIIGEINRPAIYELKGSDRLENLIQIAGGLKNTTYLNRVKINRILPNDKRNKVGIDRIIIDINLSDNYKKKKKFKLLDGDIIEFFKISDGLQNSVSISGAVSRPGIYSIDDGIKVNDLIKKADGLLGHAYLKRLDIIRLNKDLTQNQMTVNLDSAMLGDLDHNISLAPRDSLIVHSTMSMLYKNNVRIDGHVLMPGDKPFREGMTVSDLLFLGGGFQNKSHYANTYLKRAELIKINFENFSYDMIPFRLDSALLGKGLADSLISMGDKIRVFSKTEIIGQIASIVTASGAFKNPGVYEYYEDMTIRDLLFEAGALNDKSKIESLWLQRGDIISFDDTYNYRSIRPFDVFNVINNDQANFYLKKGDEVRLYSKDLFGKENIVYIDGDVARPGGYDLKVGMTIKDLLLEAGGTSQKRNNFIIDIAGIIDKDDKGKKYASENRIIVNEGVENFITSSKVNPTLSSGDIVTVRFKKSSSALKTVSIIGEVNYPGSYVITSSEELVTDIIDRAGGLTKEAYALSSLFIRDGQSINLSFERIIRNPRSSSNFNVVGGDSIIINGFTNVVKIIGEINNPGSYQYFKNKRASDYISLAGGFTSDADKFNSFISYPDGTSKKLKFSQLAKVKDGSVITILKEGEKPEFSLTEYVTNLTSIYADFSQAYLMIILAGRSN